MTGHLEDEEEEKARALLDSIGDECHINWFPGHMAKALRLMKENLRNAQLIIEVRDARVVLFAKETISEGVGEELPTSSSNADIEKIVKDKRRLIIFNKADLISPSQRKLVERSFKQKGMHVAMTNATEPKTLTKVIPMMRKLAPARFKTVPTSKSSIITALRRAALAGKSVAAAAAAATTTTSDSKRKKMFKKKGPVVGANPGVTRHNQGFIVSGSPPLFVVSTLVFLSRDDDDDDDDGGGGGGDDGDDDDRVYESSIKHEVDSPGIMAKNFSSSKERVQGMRLALVGCIKDHLVGNVHMARYLLHHLRSSEAYERRDHGENEAMYAQLVAALGLHGEAEEAKENQQERGGATGMLRHCRGM
eukprot:jgi/Bigna1/127543/aug1.4_g2251